MAETASRDWHAAARRLWRTGAAENDIAQRFGVSRQAVEYALRIAKVVEKGRGRQQPQTGRDRWKRVVHDELDCVSMMEAIQEGRSGSFQMLRRYSGEA